MKKLILISLLIAVVASFAFAAVQAPLAGTVAAGTGHGCAKVGWNTRSCAEFASDTPVQTLAIFVGPPVKPTVGWNS